MKRLVDIVNFNCDASCLASARWLAMLAGGRGSELCRWLSLYVRHRRKLVLGITGSGLADIRAFNPQALELINAHPEVFGAVVRPFAHDIHLLRRPASFRRNVQLGWEALRTTLPGLPESRCYLPPEFMLTGEQVGILADMGISTVLMNPSRFSEDQRVRIPSRPYRLHGLLGARLGCLPVDGSLTLDYLQAMHGYDSRSWNDALLGCASETLLAWRDGESCFLVPDGVAREEHWLSHETDRIQRHTLEELQVDFIEPSGVDEEVIAHFPVHPFAGWMKEFRMLGYLGRLLEYEDRSHHGAPLEVALWLMLINSDVLSAVEKRAVRVRLRDGPDMDAWSEVRLHRTRRDFEAEECLALLTRLGTGQDVWPLVEASSQPHLRKLSARTSFIRQIEEPGARQHGKR